MRIFIMLLISMTLLCASVYGQLGFSISGKLINEKNQALSGATVLLLPVQQWGITDGNGHFQFLDLPPGIYFLSISFIGYQTRIDTIELGRDHKIDFQLFVSNLSLDEVTISDHYIENRKKEESLNIEVVNKEFLQQNLGGSLMTSLERLPGVSTISIGSGQSKPVIRGLGFNRVVVIDNSIKHEGQQWGADHGLEIDQLAVEQIEVIKGPASLMYGSDAIGGVIDLKSRKIPLKHKRGGSIYLIGKSNNDFLGTSVSYFNRKDWFYFDLRATLIDYADYKVPTDSVDIYSFRTPLHNNRMRNTAGKEANLHGSIGFICDEFQSQFNVSTINTKSGFFANAHGLEPRNIDTALHDNSSRDILFPFQSVSHLKLINNNKYHSEKWKIALDIGFQRNFRQEWSQYTDHGWMPAQFPEGLNFHPDLDRQFTKLIYSGNLKLDYELSERLLLVGGMNSEFQSNRIGGRGFIIPEYTQSTTGGFVFGKFYLSEENIVQLGIRYDFGKLNTNEYKDWFPSPIYQTLDTVWIHLERSAAINRDFSNLSWSIGYNLNKEHWSFKANLGKSFRMPIAKELAANGVNYHFFSYEIGNPELNSETAYQLDLGIEYQSTKLAIGSTPFFNLFSNYIYLNPSSQHDRLYGYGNQIFYYTQSEVLRYGLEIHAHYTLIKDLQLGFIGEYLYSEQLSGDKQGFTLPFSPPPSAIFNIKYRWKNNDYWKNVYFSFDYRLSAAQNNIVPPEEPTPGFQVFDLRFGGDLNYWNQSMKLSIQLKNLLNTKYFNHTSYYRLINVPEPGRNIIVSLVIPFTEKKTKSIKP